MGLLISTSSQAEVVLNGFANIVAGMTTSSDETVYGFDDSLDFKTGSLLAIQASSDLGNGLGVTAQIMSRGDDNWEANFEWAFVSYDANDNLRFLLGKQRVPFYMYSDYLDVSYAYPWITPLEGVYSVAFDTFEGLGAIYSDEFVGFDTSIQVIYGSNTEDINLGEGPVEPDFKDLMGLAVTVNKNWLTLRAAYLQADMNAPFFDGLANGWNLAGFPDIADNIAIEGDTGKFVEFGFQLDFEHFIAIGEFTRLTLDGTTLANQDSYFILGGYKISDWLIHVTYGADENERDNFASNAPSIPSLSGPTQGLIASQQRESNYTTVGARWDVHPSAALKLEYTDFSDDTNSSRDAGLFRTSIVTVF